jgi:hypothetical protein
MPAEKSTALVYENHAEKAIVLDAGRSCNDAVLDGG